MVTISEGYVWLQVAELEVQHLISVNTISWKFTGSDDELHYLQTA